MTAPLFILLQIVFGLLHQPQDILRSSRPCGRPPDADRTLSMGRLADPTVANRLNLVGCYVKNGQPEIVIDSLLKGYGQTYTSYDRGRTWVKLHDRLACTQFGMGHLDDIWSPCILSRKDVRIRYRNKGAPHSADFERSIDGGRTWQLVHPRVKDGRHLGLCDIRDTGIWRDSRVYAYVSSVGILRSYAYSDDYGSTFMPSSRTYESRANASVLFKTEMGKEDFGAASELSRSDDGGRNWKVLSGARPVLLPLHERVSDAAQLYVRRSSPRDREVDLRGLQVEADPLNEQVFYVFSRSKGIYRTMDGGSTFVLLPLAEDRWLEIGSVMVDPVDGRYIYASVGRQEIYGSDDYGCSWNVLAIPER